MIFQETVKIAPPNVVWTIVGVAIAMSLFSRWFSKRFSIPREAQMQRQMEIQELQDRMKQAKGNQELILEMNEEMMKLMKEMYKKQLIPMMIRSFIWFGLYGLLNLLFGDYDEYIPFDFLWGRKLISLYLVVSFSFSIVWMLGKYAMKKINPETDKKSEHIFDHIRALGDTNIYRGSSKQNSPIENGNFVENNNLDNNLSDSNEEKIIQSGNNNNNNNNKNNNSNKSWKNRLDD